MGKRFIADKVKCPCCGRTVSAYVVRDGDILRPYGHNDLRGERCEGRFETVDWDAVVRPAAGIDLRKKTR